ncbi:MAG TPA: peptide chain release factor N(5)-glutamine methyltransferase [Gaiellaceae bacterium]|nr:peptide chain release factor N(5)-glutamine methyltransferase [Gaiellaceae bacterium]
MTLGEVLKLSTGFLSERGVASPRLDAEFILAHALGLARLDLYLEHDRPLTEAELDRCRSLVERRGRREPLAYVLGEWGFRRLTLRCDGRALVPRPETEVLVERALALLDGVERPAVLDVGTGTGAVALSVAHERPDARVTALDISPGALDLARENAEANRLDVTLREGDYRTGLPDGPYDLIVSNPPYVKPAEIETLEPEVRDWEPREALVSDDGPAEVARAAAPVLKPGGALALEVGDGQAPAVAAALSELGYRDVTITVDLNGRERIVEGRIG